jgi:hypothetical protein
MPGIAEYILSIDDENVNENRWAVREAILNFQLENKTKIKLRTLMEI